ncbi:FG-nucleoporin nsp1 [Coemansia sp. RSA 989]|nr:Nsp1-like C-terminal region-domain-containing protein [Coemansia mojavensis]KAJ1865798.1 FG-nucleoporin nsp1 [Coemansia sp. RSA 989]KAJ1875191.1 FG-nucleoporin nsp1 [Coemansia sp. RSA 990]KAJ2650589.1 FG-nucleoporin nsp1 [Coemansia sp. RSA 1250]
MFNAATGGNKGGGGFSFGLGSSTSGASGNQATTSEAAKPAAAFSFGGTSTTSLFGTTAASSEAKPAGFSLGTSGGSSLFGAAKPASTGFSFGTSAATASTASTASAAPSFGALATGTGFGAKPAASEAASTTAASTASFGGFKAPSGLSFGSTATPSTAAASAATSAATPAAPATGFGFGSAAAPSTTGGSSKPLFGTFGAQSSAAETKTETTAAANPTTGTGLGGFKLSTAPAVSTCEADKSKTPEATVTSKPAANAAESKSEDAADLANAALRGKTLEEIAQMWTAELTTQTRAFHTQANTVGYWDRALVQQGKRITQLYEATMAVEAEQAALDQSLEHMEGQQSALQALLDTYEGRVQDIVHKTTAPKTGARGGAMTADQERDLVYSSAERLNQQMEELARRLTTLVEDVNAISSASAEDGQRAADPFAQIVEILNAHLTSLEWVDTQTSQLQDRLKNAEKVYQDVVSAQSAGHGGLGSIGAPDQPSRDVLTIPGAFVNDPPPPATSSFGTPMAPRKSVLTRAAAGASPFAGTPQRRGF